MNKKKNETPRQSRKRSWQVGGILLVVMLLVIGWLGFIYAKTAITQRAHGQSLRKDAQRLYQQTNFVSAKRGNIYDSAGNVLAENTTTYTVAVVLNKDSGNYAKPSQYHRIAKEFAKVLGKDASFYQTRLEGASKGAYQVEFGNVGTNLSSAKYEKLKKAKLPGVTFAPGIARFYPNGTFASHLIGIASPVVEKGRMVLKGGMGIEAAYNKLLRGKDGSTTDSTDPTMRAANKAAQNGDDIYTTLNSNLQLSLEHEMSKLDDTVHPKSAIAVIMDVKTGNLVAVSQRPSFNATTKNGLGSYWTDLLTEDQYEPGSVMKGITLAAAIATGNWNPNAYYQSGTLTIDGQKITDWNNGNGWGTISFDDGLALSSNVAFSLTEEKIGAKSWNHYIKAFHFLKSTNSGLPGEQKGSYQFKYPIEQANTSFGQGISVTPIQMIQAYSAIAGNGQLLKPNLIDKIVNPNTNKVVYQSKRTAVGKPISNKVAEKTRKQLETVLYSTKSINANFAIPDVVTAGKSGTAQISTDKGYATAGDATQEIFSWMGMAPADKPRYLMYIVVKQPQTDTGQVNDVQAEMFKTLMQQALKISEDDTKVKVSADQERKVPTFVNETTKAAVSDIKAAGMVPEVIGDGDKVIAQSPTGGNDSLIDQKVFLRTDGNITVPDMHGWTKSDVRMWGKLADVSIVVHGDGFVATQSVTPGKALSTGVDYISIEFKEPIR